MEIVVPDAYKYLYESQNGIVKVPDPVLRKKALEVTKIGKPIEQLMDDMLRLMKRANGIGLAANQVGVLKRIIVLAPLDYKPMVLLNPKIIKMEGEELGQEGCLSLPGLYGDVVRAAYVEVEGFDRKGREIVLELEGMPARVAQHEIDHLDGVLFIDKVIVESLYWTHPEIASAAVE